MAEGAGNCSRSGTVQERVDEQIVAIYVSLIIIDFGPDNVISAEGEEIKMTIDTDPDLKYSASDRFDVSLANLWIVAGLIVWVIVESQNLAVRDYLNMDTLKRIHT